MEQIEEETNRKEYIETKYENAFNHAKQKVKQLEDELKSIVQFKEENMEEDNKQMVQVIKTSTEQGRKSLKSDFRDVLRLRELSQYQTQQLTVHSDINSIKKMRLEREHLERQKTNNNQHETEMRQMEEDYNKILDEK
mmetsp:Transcript_18949/g.16785  ORF Transcript_18949/g.16785 Transcript_18949/m.16785 type:complete len:138 (+) Transcript_18949:391-804(+)